MRANFRPTCGLGTASNGADLTREHVARPLITPNVFSERGGGKALKQQARPKGQRRCLFGLSVSTTSDILVRGLATCTSIASRLAFVDGEHERTATEWRLCPHCGASGAAFATALRTQSNGQRPPARLAVFFPSLSFAWNAAEASAATSEDRRHLKKADNI